MKKSLLLFSVIFLTTINSSEAINLDEAIRQLKENRTLKTLDLSNKNIGYTGTKAIANALRENKTLTTLNLSNNNLGVEGVKAITRALIGNKTLTTLNLSSNYISFNNYETENRILTEEGERVPDLDYSGIKSIVRLLKRNNTLILLDLSQNYMDDNGARILAAALRVNTTLDSLSLNGNDLGIQGVTFIVDAIVNNRALKTLDLSNNNFDKTMSPEWYRNLGKSLKALISKNKTLISLNLSHNVIYDDDILMIALALINNHIIKTIDLSNCNMAKPLLDVINYYLERNNRPGWSLASLRERTHITAQP